MVRWIIILLMLPLIFAATKPIAGISELSGTATVHVETFFGTCSTIPVKVIGESYTANLGNLRLVDGGSCTDFWRINDTMFVTIDGMEISRSVVEPGTGVQMMPAYIVSGDREEVIIERNKPEEIVVFEPIQTVEVPDINPNDDSNITIPSRALRNITKTVEYTISDLYYKSVEPVSEEESVWRYLIMIIIFSLLLIGWGLRS